MCILEIDNSGHHRCIVATCSTMSIQSSTTQINLWMWHLCVNHLSLEHLANCENVIVIARLASIAHLHDTYHYGKHTKEKFPKQNDTWTFHVILQLLHTWSLWIVKCHVIIKIIITLLTIANDFNIYTWVFFLTKSRGFWKVQKLQIIQGKPIQMQDQSIALKKGRWIFFIRIHHM
jgi:hypothetical protein